MFEPEGNEGTKNGTHLGLRLLNFESLVNVDPHKIEHCGWKNPAKFSAIYKVFLIQGTILLHTMRLASIFAPI